MSIRPHSEIANCQKSYTDELKLHNDLAAEMIAIEPLLISNSETARQGEFNLGKQSQVDKYGGSPDR